MRKRISMAQCVASTDARKHAILSEIRRIEMNLLNVSRPKTLRLKKVIKSGIETTLEGWLREFKSAKRAEVAYA